MVKLGSGKYLRLAVRLESAVNNVESCVPFVVVVFHKCKSGDILASADGIQGMKETAEFLYFPEFPVIPVVIVEDAVPVQFRAEGGSAPAKEGDIIRALCHRLHCPQGELARPRSGHFHTVYPAASSALLLHDAEMRTDRACFNEISCPHAVFEICGTLVQFKGKVRIRVIGIHIQDFVLHAVIIQIGEKAVGCDKIFWLLISADNIRLHSGETYAAFGNKARVIQQQVRVTAVVEHRSRAVNLTPVSISLTPEYGAPGLVKCIQGAVFLFHEHPECLMIGIRVEFIRLTVELIVELPADDGGVLAIVLRQLLDDTGGKTPVHT